MLLLRLDLWPQLFLLILQTMLNRHALHAVGARLSGMLPSVKIPEAVSCAGLRQQLHR